MCARTMGSVRHVETIGLRALKDSGSRTSVPGQTPWTDAERSIGGPICRRGGAPNSESSVPFFDGDHAATNMLRQVPKVRSHCMLYSHTGVNLRPGKPREAMIGRLR